MVFPPKPDELGWFVGLVVGFGLLGGALVVEVLVVRHEMKPTGLLAVTPWHGRRFLSWSQVKTFRFSPAMQLWRAATAGEATWISVYPGHFRPESATLSRPPRRVGGLVGVAE